MGQEESRMRVGDLVRMQDGKGFSWWIGRTFLILGFEEDYPEWVNLLTDDGGKIQVERKLLEVLL